MAAHSSILAWKFPWTEELGRLQSSGAQGQTRLSDQARSAPAPTACAQLSEVPHSSFVFCFSRCLSSWECHSEGSWVSACLNADLS